MERDFEGKVALVTGGASGIGRSTCELLAARGASVVVADLDADGAAAVAEKISGAGGAAVVAALDVTDPAQVEAAVALAVETYGRLDVAVNDAGVSDPMRPLADQPLDAWERTVGVNLTGVFLCLRAEIPRMLETGGGAVVNVSSAAGMMGFAQLPAYVASKHGVIGLTKAVALEFARKGVRVNAVCPASTGTPMLLAFAGSEEVMQSMGAAQPVGRLGTPEEVAEAIVWLCSDAASYVTGHALAVDGGVLAT